MDCIMDCSKVKFLVVFMLLNHGLNIDVDGSQNITDWWQWFMEVQSFKSRFSYIHGGEVNMKHTGSGFVEIPWSLCKRSGKFRPSMPKVWEL